MCLERSIGVHRIRVNNNLNRCWREKRPSRAVNFLLGLGTSPFLRFLQSRVHI